MNEHFNKFLNLTIGDIPCPMRFVEGGTMDLGENLLNTGGNLHSVTVPSFYMAQYQVTQALYEAVMETNPSQIKGANRPVTKVSWHDAKAFIKKLNAIAEKKFRLPSESEWEFAARGGINCRDYKYCGGDDLRQVGWYKGNSRDDIKPIGLLLPNELGIYDMSGNVQEWCEDDYYWNYKNAPKDGSAWVGDSTVGGLCVVRGGCYSYGTGRCWPSDRNDNIRDNRINIIGFRLVFSLKSKVNLLTTFVK